MYAEYVAKIKGDISALDKTIREAQGKIQRLADDEVLIKFDYDGNAKQFNKVFQSIIKKHPELTVQLQYDLNKQFLDEKMAELKQLEAIKMTMDPSDIEGELTDITNKIEKTKSSIEMINGELERLSSSNPGLKLNAALNEAQVSSKETADNISQVTNAADQLNKSTAMDSFGDSVEDVNDALDSTAKKLDEVKSLGETVKMWHADKSVTNERYTPFNTQSKEVSDATLVAGATGIQAKLIESALKDATIAVDGFIHSHPTKTAAFSDADIRAFYELVNKGITQQVVVSLEEAMTLDMSKVDTSKAAEISNVIKNAYDEIDKGIEEDISSYMDDIKNATLPLLQRIKADDPAADSALKEFVARYPTVMDTLREAMSFDEYLDVMDKVVTLVAKNDPSISSLKGDALMSAMGSLGSVFEIMEASAADVMTNHAQKAYQKVLQDVFSDPTFLKEGVTSALKIESLSTFIDQNSIKEAAKEMTETAKKAIADSQDSASPSEESKELGHDLGDGYVVGIKEKIPDVEEAAKEMTEAALEAIRATQESNSPSERSRKLAHDLGDGTVAGLRDKADEIKKAASDVTEGAIEGIQETVSEDLPKKFKLNLDYSDVAKQLQDDYVKQAFSADVENTNLGKMNQLLVESHDLLQKQVDDIVEATQAQMSQVSLANQFGDAIKEYTDGLEIAGDNAEELQKSLKAAMDVTRSEEGGSSLELLDDLHTYEAELAEGYREAAAAREKVLKKTKEFNEAIIDAENKRQKKEKEVAEKSKKDAVEAQEAQQKAAEKTISSLSKQTEKYLEASKYSQQINNNAQDLLNTFERLSAQDVINEEDIKAATQAFEQLKKEASLATGKAVNPNKLSNIINEIDKYSRKYSGLSDKTKASLDAVIQAMKEAPNDEVFKSLYRDFLNIQQAARAAGEETQTSFKRIGDRLKDMNAKFIAQFFSIQDIIRYVRELSGAVVELDSALTELRKVSDASTERLQLSFEKSAITAQELGSTISDVINITSDWARLGYDVDAAEELARVTTLFKTVGDNMTADDASSYLVSTMQGFQIAADQAETIVDKYNQVANNFAIDTKGIGEALQRSAASFNAANTDLSKSIALITATNEVVQNPESVGTLWKTMSARIRGAKTELEDLGEEEDDFTKTTSKLRDLVKGLTGFDIMKNENEFKDIYEIILGIGKEWDKLTDIERASLGEALAGKRNANALYAVLGNLDTLEKAYAEAEKAEGSAAKEQENYAKSVQYSIDRFKASVEELSYDFLNSGLLKGIIEFGNALIRILDAVVQNKAVLTLLVAALGGGVFLKNKSKIISSLTEIATRVTSLTKGVQLFSKTIDPAAVSLSEFMKLVSKGGKVDDKTGLMKIPGLLAGIPSSVKIAGAAVAAVTATAIIAWNHYNTTVQETQDQIDKVSEKLNELKTEYQELSDLENRTEAQETRLSLLEEELEIQKELLDIAERKKALESVTSESDSFAKQFTDWYDNDNYSTQLRKSQEKYYYNQRYDYKFGENETEYSKLIELQKQYNEELANAEEGSKEWNKASEKLAETTEKIQQIESDIKGDYGEVYSEYASMYSNYQNLLSMMEQYKDDPFLYEKLEEEANAYSDYIEILRSYLIRAREKLGRDTSDLTIDSRLSDANLKIAGSNQADLDALTEKTKAFSHEQKEAWIVATDGAKSAAEATKLWEDSLKTVEEQLTRLAQGSLFNVEKFNEVDNELESLQSLYDSFRNNVENNELKVPIDISDVEALPDTWKNLESFKEFELKVTTSTNIDEVQKAFDDFATDYARNSIKIQGLTKETMDMVKAQMKMDGLEEGGVNKLVDSLAAEEKMNQFVDALERGQDAEGNMEDAAVDAAVAIYDEGKQLGITDAMLQDYLVQALQAGNVVLGGDTSWLDLLAEKLDIDIGKLKELLGLAGQGSGYATSYDSAGNQHITSTYMPGGTNAKDWASQQQKWRNDEKYRNASYVPTATTKSGGGGGSDEDPYVKKFEEELKKLDELRDRGLITEKEYLNKQKELIDKFFKDREKYAEEYAKRLADYLKNMQTYYNSVISGVTTLIDHRISSLQSERDSVVDSLTEEKEAAMERYQAEIDAIDDAIKAKEKEKEKLQDQIDAIEKANAARDRAINLQKAEYELQRAMNQRTRLVYTGEPGQMVYERDESAVRDKQEAKQDALDDIAKAKIQEQIDLIDKEISKLNEEREAIQAQMESMSKYYDNLIKQQEKMFDEMIKKLEDTKKKWEELAEIESIANAWSLVQNEMKEFGFTVEDVLNDTPGAFEAFKDAYISNLAKMHEGDQGFLDGLAEATGQAKETFGQLAESAAETKDAMSDIAEATAPLSDAANNITAVGTAASGASSGVKELKEATDGIADNLNNMDFSACETFQECIGNAQEKVKELIELISGENGIKGAIEALNNPEMLSAIGTSFTELGKAIGSVATALGVGTGGGESSEGGDNTSSRSASMSEGSDESQGGGGEGLVGAIEEIKNATDTYIGTDSTAEGENAIGSFVALKTAVDNVTTAIGQGGEEGEGGKSGKGGEGEGEGGTLTAAITSLQQVTADSLVADGDNGVIGMFETLAAAIEKCASAAQELLSAIQGLSGAGVDVGKIPWGYSGTAYPHYEGTAKLSGDWGVRDNERALVGELGQEVVIRRGKFFTVGDRGLKRATAYGDICIKYYLIAGKSLETISYNR